jgi:ethanolamine utilization protein EutL
MGVLDPLVVNPLAVRLIPNVDPSLAKQLNLEPEQKSIGLITADNDHATYVAVDEATKMADVKVVYAHSFYAGAKHASGKLSGEIIAILAGPNPAEVRAGLNSALAYMKNEAIWYSANEDNSIAFFPHLVSRSGSYLSTMCNIPLGAPIAYLIAPPMEGMLALDAALKAAAVHICALTMPPSVTNYMGVMLTGDQSACKAATIAFRDMVLEVAQNPFRF